MDPMGGMGGSPAAYSDPFQGVPMQDTAAGGMGGAVGGAGGGAIPEMTALREWEAKHEQELEETSRKEDADKNERRKSAAEELKQWYDDRSANRDKRLATNRTDEATAETARAEAMQP